MIPSPPTDHPYDTLKEQLIKRTAASEQRRLQQLFNAEELGDRKPSQLLRRMQQLLGDKANTTDGAFMRELFLQRLPSNVRMQQLLGDKANTTDGAFMRELFLQRLPSNVRMVLASTPDAGSLDELAQLADKIAEVATPSISSVNTSTEFEHLRQEVAELKLLIQTLKQPNRRSRGRSPSPAPQGLCWYHTKFGDSARKCKPPCAKSSENARATTGVTGLLPSRLFYIMDKSSSYRFLIDTGAEISVIPPSHSDRKYRQEGCNFLAVNGSIIATYGKRSLTLDLGLRRTFRWVFIIANVQSPILGTDFLRQYSCWWT